MHIDHIAIWTLDLERLRDFYARYFNCLASVRYDNFRNHFSSYFLSFPSGARIEIMKRADIHKMPDPDRTGIAHFAIRLNSRKDVNDLTRRLEEDGVAIESQPRTTGDGYYESVILDPDQNRIELTAI